MHYTVISMENNSPESPDLLIAVLPTNDTPLITPNGPQSMILSGTTNGGQLISSVTVLLKQGTYNNKPLWGLFVQSVQFLYLDPDQLSGNNFMDLFPEIEIDCMYSTAS